MQNNQGPSALKIKSYFESLSNAEKVIAVQYLLSMLKDSELKVQEEKGKLKITLLTSTKFVDNQTKVPKETPKPSLYAEDGYVEPFYFV